MKRLTRTLALAATWLAVCFLISFIGLSRADAGGYTHDRSHGSERDHGDREHQDRDHARGRDHKDVDRRDDDREHQPTFPVKQPCHDKENRPCPCPPPTGHTPPSTIPRKPSTPTTSTTTSTTVTPPTTPTTSPLTPPTSVPSSPTLPPTPQAEVPPAGPPTATPELAFGGSSAGVTGVIGLGVALLGLAAYWLGERRRNRVLDAAARAHHEASETAMFDATGLA